MNPEQMAALKDVLGERLLKEAMENADLLGRRSDHLDAMRFHYVDWSDGSDETVLVSGTVESGGKLSVDSRVPLSKPAAEVECGYCGCAAPLTRTHCRSCGGPRKVVK